MEIIQLKKMAFAQTFLAEFSLEASDAVAFAVGAMSVAVAIRHLALVVAQTALLALPARVALALPVDIFTPLTTQNWTNTCQ
jgi:hypothetical protein